MTIINLTACDNGAHANQTKNGTFKRIPEGWAVVPESLESAAQNHLPWVALTVEDGAITGITEDTAAKEAWAALEAAREENEEGEKDGN